MRNSDKVLLTEIFLWGLIVFVLLFFDPKLSSFIGSLFLVFEATVVMLLVKYNKKFRSWINNEESDINREEKKESHKEYSNNEKSYGHEEKRAYNSYVKKNRYDFYFDVLGISLEDRLKDSGYIKRILKSKYRKLAMQWHPDRFSGKSDLEIKMAEEKFKMISEAYTELIKFYR